MRFGQKGAAPGSILATLALAGVVMAGAATYDAGLVSVSVREGSPEKCSFGISVPGIVVPVAMALVPDRIFDDIPPEAARQMPAILAVARELDRIPDGPLVEIDTPDEMVRVTAKRGVFLVEIRTREERVRVRVPASLIESVIARVEEATRDRRDRPESI
jgi:hypothetical protein